MSKFSKKKVKLYSVMTRKLRIDGIFPFTESPSVDKITTKEKEKKNKLCASDLFSLFTADIIKEDVIFTR